MTTKDEVDCQQGLNLGMSERWRLSENFLSHQIFEV